MSKGPPGSLPAGPFLVAASVRLVKKAGVVFGHQFPLSVGPLQQSQFAVLHTAFIFTGTREAVHHHR